MTVLLGRDFSKNSPAYKWLKLFVLCHKHLNLSGIKLDTVILYDSGGEYMSKTRSEVIEALNECAAAFFNGFERKIEAMLWTYHSDQVNFDTFDPGLRKIYDFRAKLDFALWALQRAGKDLPALREHFMDHVRDVFIRV
jgi:hypothetical protein